MTDKLTALVGYLSRRSAEAAYGHPQYWFTHLLPPVPSLITDADVEAFTAYLLQDAELQAINLGTWLTMHGQQTLLFVIPLTPVFDDNLYGCAL